MIGPMTKCWGCRLEAGGFGCGDLEGTPQPGMVEEVQEWGSGSGAKEVSGSGAQDIRLWPAKSRLHPRMAAPHGSGAASKSAPEGVGGGCQPAPERALD